MARAVSLLFAGLCLGLARALCAFLLATLTFAPKPTGFTCRARSRNCARPARRGSSRTPMGWVSIRMRKKAPSRHKRGENELRSKDQTRRHHQAEDHAVRLPQSAEQARDRARRNAH